MRSSKDAWLWVLVAVLWLLLLATPGVTFGITFTETAIWLVVLVGLIVTHELGHALVGRLLGYRIFEVSIGAGPSLAVQLGGTRVAWGILPLQGHTLLAPTSARLLPAREVFVSLAGVAVNVLTLAWALVTSDPFHRHTGVLLVVGGLVVVQNLLPVRVMNRLGVVQSDGMRAVLALDTTDVTEAAMASLNDVLASLRIEAQGSLGPTDPGAEPRTLPD